VVFLDVKARRNLTEQNFAYTLGLRYELEKQPLGGQKPNEEGVGKNYQPTATAQKLAEEHGVSEKTVRNAADYAKDVDALGESRGGGASPPKPAT
jgi:hypothetical protein